MVTARGTNGCNDLETRVSKAVGIRPDRLIIDELVGNEAVHVFRAGNLGVPFLATLRGNLDPESLIDKLMSKPLLVESGSINATDVAIFMERQRTKRRIASIVEYGWATNDSVGTEETGEKLYSVSDIFRDGSVDAVDLNKSKSLMAYARQTFIPIQSALAEFRKRSDFIDRMPRNDPDLDTYFKSYWG